MQIVGIGENIAGVEIDVPSVVTWNDLVDASANALHESIAWVQNQHYITNSLVYHDLNLSGIGSMEVPLGLQDPIVLGDRNLIQPYLIAGTSGLRLKTDSEIPFEIRNILEKLFYIDKNGNVSAKGNISANGVELAGADDYGFIDV